MEEYKSRLSTYLSDLVREELEKYDGGFTDEWNDQRKKNAEVLGYKLSGKSDIKEGATEFWMDMFRPGPIPKKYINQLIKKKGELPSKKHIKKIYRDNGNPSSSQLAKTWKQLQKEKYVRAASGMWRWNADFTGWESVNEGLQNSQGEQTDFKKGDLVKDINPDCPHHGSEGEVTKVGKGTITFDVSNNGKNYQQGDELEKTVDQMVKLKESVNEGFTKYHIRLTDTPGWYGVWDKKGKQKFEGDKRFVMKNLKKLKTRMGNFQLKSLIGVATKRKGKDIEFDVVESVNEGGMGILTTDQADVLQSIVMKNKNKNSRAILKIVMKDSMFKGVDKREMLGYIEGTQQFVKYIRMGRTGNESVKEERDYKAEYKKFQSSPKAKKYRAELNQYNRKKGTYGNNDGKDASHKGGKIVGFEKESTNRGRREKSRLKKEDIREFSGDQGIHVYLGGILMGMKKARLKPKTAKQMKHGFSKSRDKIGFFIEVEKREIEGKKLWTLQLEIDRDGYLWYLSAPRDIKIGKWADRSQLVRGFKKLNMLPGFGQDAIFKRRK